MGNFEQDCEFDELKDNLLTELFKDAEMPQTAELNASQKDEFLRVLMITHMGEAASEKLILAQDKFLKLLNEKNKIDVEKLKFKNSICLVGGNILDYCADLLVVGSTNAFEDVESLLAGKQSLDNDLLFRAGLELKSELLKNASANPNLIFAKGYNLNAKYVAKIVLANAVGAQNLIAENLNLVFKFLKEKELKSVAIDFNSVLNTSGSVDGQKNFEILQKTIENLNKKTKIKVILKKFC